VPSEPLGVLAQIGSLTELRLDALWEDAAVQLIYRNALQLRVLHRVTARRLLGGTVVNGWNERSLQRLTEGECGVDYPPLQALGILLGIGVELVLLLLRLPSLTKLDPMWISLLDMRPLLAGLSELRTITVVLPLDVLEPSLWWSHFAEAILLCPQLTKLSLSGTQLTHALSDEQLTVILRAVPRLQSLTIANWRQTTLRCIAEAPHLVATLQRLVLTGTTMPSELVHLRLLSALRSLTMNHRAPAEPLLRAQLTPGHPQFLARHWPRLEQVNLNGPTV